MTQESNGASAVDRKVLHPFVLWGQKDQNLYLTVQLQGVTDPIINLDEGRLTFFAKGYGCHGNNVYQFEIDLYLPVQRKLSSWKVKEKCVEFHLMKESSEIWPRLTSAKQREPWIKVNFDHMQFSDDSEQEEPPFPKWDSDDSPAPSSRRRRDDDRIRDAVSKDMDKFFAVFRSPLKLYLFLYNMFQWVGFCYVFHVSLYSYLRAGSKAQRQEAFASIRPQLCMVQLAASLEILNAALGWVRSGVLATGMQVFGRGMILFMLVLPYEELQRMEPVLWLAVTWSAVEVVRYPYYILAVLGQESGLVTWLRYTMWIPLYPLGFVLEGLVMLAALPRVMEERWYSVELPNKFNMSFDFSLFLRVYMVGFLVGAYALMSHMYAQRKKKFGANPRSQFSRWGLLPFLSGRNQRRALGLDSGDGAGGRVQQKKAK
ncbi:hypothetical protein BOX15_Mlig030674g1 [Macrostomum lignano]|uniref:Uncharacterized protein n=2 Tax=Macrostomum lignano TaxID=282301 RepID=A0A267GMV6_9PLAT|nr:hypothetical protein BOX15_Mlig030674g1 [Macrostomum lignano]